MERELFCISFCEISDAVSFSEQVHCQSKQPLGQALPSIRHETSGSKRIEFEAKFCQSIQRISPHSTRLRLQWAAGQPATRRCVSFPFGNFVPRRLLHAHGRQRSTGARKCEFWQRHRAPKRQTKNGSKMIIFQRSTADAMKKDCPLAPTVDR